jgi:hypothetical protein
LPWAIVNRPCGAEGWDHYLSGVEVIVRTRSGFAVLPVTRPKACRTKAQGNALGGHGTAVGRGAAVGCGIAVWRGAVIGCGVPTG